MSVPIELLIYLLIFVAVVLLVEGIYLTVFGKSISLNSKVNRRLDMLDKGAAREEVLEKLRKEMDQHVLAQQIPLYSLLASKAQKAAIAFTPAQLVMIMVALSVFAFFALTFGTAATFAVRLAGAIVMGVGGVYFWVNRKANKRMEMVEEQLPDAVELMVRSLRVGHPFTSSVQIVADEVADPLGTEMGIIADESAYGRDVGEALSSMAERMDNQDMRFLAVAVTIQQTSGGNLAEILDGLAKVIRSRFRLFRRVKAITAEASWSARFLSGFPLIMIIAINVIEPTYFDEVKETPYFMPACIFVGVFLVLNIIVMRMLVNIKV